MNAEKMLRILGPLHVVAGLLLTITVFTPDIQTRIGEMMSMPVDTPTARFLLAVLGPTIASWGVLFTTIVTSYFERPTPFLWYAMLFSIAVWAPLDTGLCLWFKVYGGALVNSLVVVLFVFLLFSVRRLAYVDVDDRT